MQNVNVIHFLELSPSFRKVKFSNFSHKVNVTCYYFLGHTHYSPCIDCLQSSRTLGAVNLQRHAVADCNNDERTAIDLTMFNITLQTQFL